MKRLVVCCDGTWNRPDQFDRGKARPSNVAKMAMAIKPQASDEIVQRMYYHPGVGTGRWDRFRGGAFGMGLSRNIQDAYAWLVRNFEPGDKIFLCGFSRGAYTVRSLAGLIRNCGILRSDNLDKLRAGYRLYRRRDDASHPASYESRLFRDSYSHETRIWFIGVWDTVGSLGFPPGLLAPFNGFFGLRFHDTQLSSWVDNAFQALAIDERRRPFKPSIWKQREESNQVVEQAWFPGVHTNVGGGYADSGLSDITFQWIAERAIRCRLDLAELPAEFQLAPNPSGEIRNSRTGLYRLWYPYLRPVSTGSRFPTYEHVHSSTYERMRLDGGYAPANVSPLPLETA